MAEEVIACIDEFGREEFPILDPGQKVMVAGPEGERFQVEIGDPLEEAFFVLFWGACEFGGREDENVPVLAFKTGEHEQSAQTRMGNLQAGFFEDLADHAFFWRFTRFEFAAEAVPFAGVDIIRAFGAVQH